MEVIKSFFDEVVCFGCAFQFDIGEHVLLHHEVHRPLKEHRHAPFMAK